MALHFRNFLLVFCIFAGVALSAKFDILNETWTNPTGPDMLLKRLVNADTNESVLIIYTGGGRIEEINLRSHSSSSNDPISVISGHNGNASAIVENAHYKGCALMPWANRIANATYNFYGKQYTVPINEPRLQDALHGFIYNQTLSVINESITSTYAELILGITFSKKLGNLYPGYPFEFTIRTIYRLNSSSFADVRIEAENIGDMNTSEALPFYAAWHPYFNVENISESILQFDADCEYDNLDCGADPQTSDLIPTGYSKPWDQWNGKNTIGVAPNSDGQCNYFDDAYRVFRHKNSERIIRNKVIDPIRKNTFVLWQESDVFQFNQLYTGIAYQTGEQAIAFEPQSASTNGYNNGDHLTVLYPGQRFEGTFGFYVE